MALLVQNASYYGIATNSAPLVHGKVCQPLFCAELKIGLTLPPNFGIVDI